MFFGPDGSQLPEEIEEALRAHLDRAQMSADATRHAVIRFFEELNPEQLITLRLLLHTCAGDESGRYPSHLEGFISGILQFKHGVCNGCGQKHDDPSELIEKVKEGERITYPNTVEKDDPALIADGTEQLELFAQGDEGEISPLNRPDAMAVYGLREPNETDFRNGLVVGPNERPVLCEGCGSLYQSLEDRMLRAPGVDGCFGCQHKAAHG